MSCCRALATVSLASLVCLAASSPAHAQEVMNKDAAAVIRYAVPLRPIKVGSRLAGSNAAA